MKHKISKLLTLILSISILFIGCTDTTTENNNSNEGLNIVTSFYPIYISTLNVIKDVPNVNLINLTKAQTGCLHDYQLTPSDLKTLEKADIFVVNGAGMESFLDKVISQYENINIVNASEGISLLESDHDHDAGDDEHEDYDDDLHIEGEEDHDHEHNPHVWVSISKNIQQVKNISAQLSKLDPEHAAQYESNANEYISKLEALSTEMHTVLDNVEKHDIITFHEAFPYFAEEFGLNIVGVLEVEPDSEPSAKELEEIMNKVKEYNINALFVEPQYSSKAADVVANETGAKIYTLDPIVTGEATPLAKDDYINKMKENLEVLKEALK